MVHVENWDLLLETLTGFCPIDDYKYKTQKVRIVRIHSI